ncbi:riboflavin biosynthesis pyrimidine reductase [Streptomyces sp. Amel2xB2]|uniref:pyrimidine reductase family protein n=1 Tax=Streptomyces sp. Amel2xB2 TaxID=1305829 RepID=UPI000DBAC69D|nr:pyrimidine reductase family protein [Streptomyces sp. Amel2xB2]RAJ58737.1 riboflavin biosynthesis pyrimidine reductase [Streptomyces sp. Amel2xB2]
MRRLFPCPGDDGSASGTAPASGSVPGSGSAPGPDSASGPGADGGQWSIDALADAYAYPEEYGHRPGSGAPDTAPAAPAAPGVWLRANMVSSLDGAAHHEGRSQPLSSEADMRIFGVLRGLADAVVVGAQTVRQEGYGPPRERRAFARRRAAAGQGPAPAIAVVSAGLDLDFSQPLFTSPLVPTLLVTGAGAPSDRVAAARAAGAEVVFAGEGATADPARLPGALAERGLRRLLTEGGPRLLGQLVAGGALDEMCLTISPRVTSGEAPRIVNGPGVEVPVDFRLAGVLEEDGFLFTRYRRTGSRAA